ncbi:MAG: 3-phosphoshikimate 1-carboxyvinyltransferase [Proteobacteria bacterium]|nr:3-phosphoshikimate 1-carboxyvinyltransferase [Pseudomonadota bacterium]MBU1584379.1 3-phosphoshikimate 1-carboxyvinyltransferase [Pseudomonadota bacterium]MBU2452270.1 3-phosphoshikimate 1-carboxyvinyltransferase [Pseudomonadota bacterium]MBU2630942.1 3-phosphoshikimate 1-carboxyvinyltransferase [Pseudomonadota bacterium]
MKKIAVKKIKDQTVVIPGSKSISHRMMICASLSSGTSTIQNLLQSDDIKLTIKALKQMGAKIDQAKETFYTVTGFGGNPQPCNKDIYLGNSGTSMRLLTGIAALGKTEYTLTGDQRMCERPMIELLDALTLLGIHARSDNTKGTPPVYIRGDSRDGGPVKIDCSKSSQYLSSLLMMGAVLKNGLDISLESVPVSSPYIDLTIDIMKKFKIAVYQIDTTHYTVPGLQSYVPGNFFVEPDLSNAGYFWAIGAITGNMVCVKNISENSLQGDLKQIRILEQMGCILKTEDNMIGVCGSNLKGIDVDMSDTPDAVPAISVVASFAKGKTRITNIKHLREKECDRIDAVSSQLMKMGITVEAGEDYLYITGGRPRGARIETFNDHRIAMAFSMPGLIIPGMEIENESCVEKSFPNYWDIFDAL